MVERKEVIMSKRQIDFYTECYKKFGYALENIQKVDRNYTMVFTRKTSKTCANHDNSINLMEEKLRVIEITERKKCGFNSLYFNLLVHISLFCIQGAILFTLNHQDAHPKVMLQLEVLLFWIFLLVGFVIKLVEIFRWNRLQKHLKHEIEEMSLDYINSTSNSAFAEQDDDSKTISVLFTRSHDPISELVYWVSGRQYTHASIGLDANNECFYSFIGQGFRCEHPSHRKLKNHRKVSLCYQFKVSSEEYYQLENTINEYIHRKCEFKYNIIGVVFCVLHIYMPLKQKRVYFCSEFVAEQYF